MEDNGFLMGRHEALKVLRASNAHKFLAHERMVSKDRREEVPHAVEDDDSAFRRPALCGI
jgi:hypothetical protein